MPYFVYVVLPHLYVINLYRLFLISNFRRVLNILCFLLGSSPASQTFSCINTPTVLQSHFIPPAYEDGTDRVFRNVGIYNSDPGELPKRKHKINGKRQQNFVKRHSTHFRDKPLGFQRVTPGQTDAYNFRGALLQIPCCNRARSIGTLAIP